MKKIFLLIIMVVSAICYSQTEVSRFDIDLKNNRDIFQIVNDSTKQTHLFLCDKKKINVFLLDDQMKAKDSISTTRPEKSYKDIIGYSGNKNNYNLYFANKDRDKICGININLDKRTTDKSTHQFDFMNERFLECFSENDKFYLMTILVNSSVLKLYVFDKDGKIEIKNINLKPFKFLTKGDYISNLSDVFEQTIGGLSEFESSNTIQKINTESPTSIVQTAKKRKFYSNSNEITISLDFSVVKTQIIFIDLKTFVPRFKEFEQKVIVGSKVKNSNSLLFENKLVQMVLSAEEMWITVKDLNNNLLKEYSANKDAEISFKNSDIVRSESSAFIAIVAERSERILEKTDQFLRKIAKSNVGIACYAIDSNIYATIGSVAPEKNVGGGGMIGSGGFGMGAFPGMGFGNGFYFSNIYFNNISNNYNSYGNRRVIFIQSIFDKNFNHLEGNVKPNVFDKIKDFKGENDLPPSDETLFKLQGAYYLGQYSNLIKSFSIKKFED